MTLWLHKINIKQSARAQGRMVRSRDRCAVFKAVSCRSEALYAHRAPMHVEVRKCCVIMENYIVFPVWCIVWIVCLNCGGVVAGVVVHEWIYV